jgi:hypothetical protein
MVLTAITNKVLGDQGCRDGLLFTFLRNLLPAKPRARGRMGVGPRV